MQQERGWLLTGLTRRRGNRADDLVLRVSGCVALVALAAALLLPVVAQLAPFVLYTMWTNGPHSPLLPTAYEPVVMLYGLLFAPVLIGALGTAATVFVEWINYHLYTRAAALETLRGLRERRGVIRLRRLFERQPFLTVFLCAITPLPYWAARVLSVLSQYSRPRHLTATALGRFPKLWFIAALGAPLGIPARWLAMTTGLALGFAATLWAAQRLRRGRLGVALASLGRKHRSLTQLPAAERLPSSMLVDTNGSASG